MTSKFLRDEIRDEILRLLKEDEEVKNLVTTLVLNTSLSCINTDGIEKDKAVFGQLVSAYYTKQVPECVMVLTT